MEFHYNEASTQRNRAWVAYQSDQWRKKSTPPVLKKEKRAAPFITISREYGCAGFLLGKLLALEMNKSQSAVIPWAVYDRMLLEKIESDHGIHKALLTSLAEKTKDEISDFFSSFIEVRPAQSSLYQKIFTTVRALAHQGHVIVIGRGAAVATKGLESGFHIRIYAPEEWRIKQIMKMHNLSEEKEARRMLKKVDREREAFVRKYFKYDLNDPNLYHIMINNARFPHEEIVDIILTGLKKEDKSS